MAPADLTAIKFPRAGICQPFADGAGDSAGDDEGWSMEANASETAQLLEQSLHAVAEADEDITPHFFARLFARHPDQKANFFHPDITCGPMVNEILESLMGLAADEGWVRSSIQELVIAHRSFGDIPLPLYGEVFDIMIETLASIAGERWTPAYEAAWRKQAATLAAMVDAGF